MSDPYKLFINNIEQLITRYINHSYKGSFCELGKITPGMGLKLDSFKHEIKHYLVADYLTLSEPYFTTSANDGSHSQPDAGYGGSHTHQIINPAPLYHLHPGERVLVVPVNKGQDYVVVARVVPHA